MSSSPSFSLANGTGELGGGGGDLAWRLRAAMAVLGARTTAVERVARRARRSPFHGLDQVGGSGLALLALPSISAKA